MARQPVSFLDEMYKAAAKSVVEKIFSAGSSYISDQWRELVATDDNMSMSKIQLRRLRYHLNKTGDFPITDLELRHMLKELKSQCERRRDYLNNEENGQAVTASWDRYRCFPSLSDILKHFRASDYVVQRIEECAVRAEELLKVVSESADKIRKNPHRMPLVRQLIKREGLSVTYSSRQGSQKRKCCIWPFYLQERGVEAALRFKYSDSIIPGKSFTLDCFLRLRESTDIVGIAIRCLKLIPSQLESVRESAKCELKQLAELHGDFSSHGDWTDWFSQYGAYRATTLKVRPNSFCCDADADEDEHGLCANSTDASPEFSDKFPEEVSYFNFSCLIGGPVNANVASSSEDAGPPLEVNITLAPHLKEIARAKLEGLVGKEGHEDSSLQEFLENIGQKATENFVHQPQFTGDISQRLINHGVVRIGVSKLTI